MRAHFQAQCSVLSQRLTGCLTCSVILSILVAGCTSRNLPPLNPGNLPTVSKNTPSDSTSNTRVRSIYEPGQLQYDLQILSVVQASSGDSTHCVDSSQVMGIVSAMFVTGIRRDQVVANIHVDSVTLRVGNGTLTPLPASPEFSFTIDSPAGTVRSQFLNTTCSADTVQSPFSGLEVVPAIRAPIPASWTDTSETQICRGSISLKLRRIAFYTHNDSQAPSTRLIRTTRVQISGSGSQWDQKVNVTGEGISNDTLLISGVPSRLQSSNGASRVELRFQAPLRIQEFIQTTVTRIVLR